MTRATTSSASGRRVRDPSGRRPNRHLSGRHNHPAGGPQVRQHQTIDPHDRLRRQRRRLRPDDLRRRAVDRKLGLAASQSGQRLRPVSDAALSALGPDRQHLFCRWACRASAYIKPPASLWNSYGSAVPNVSVGPDAGAVPPETGVQWFDQQSLGFYGFDNSAYNPSGSPGADK